MCEKRPNDDSDSFFNKKKCDESGHDLPNEELIENMKNTGITNRKQIKWNSWNVDQ